MRKITIFLFLLCIAVNVSFADSESDFEFTSYTDKKIGKFIQITKYIGNNAKCEIPEKIGNYPVLEIYCGDSLFAPKNKIKELTDLMIKLSICHIKHYLQLKCLKQKKSLTQ